MAWLEAERDTLIAAAVRAAGTPGVAAWELAGQLACWFELQGRGDDWRRVAEAALAAARRDGDALGAAVALRLLGNLHNDHRSAYDEAIACFEAAMPELTRVGDRHEQAATLGGLGEAYVSRGHPVAAIRYFERALEALDGLGEYSREGSMLYLLALGQTNRGRLAEAHAVYLESIERYRRAGDLRGEAYARHGIGGALLEGGDPDQAAVAYEDAQVLAREAGDRTFRTLGSGLGYARRDQGRFAEALAELRTALTVSRELESKRCQALALYGLGTTMHRLGDLGEAQTLLAQGLQACRAIGDQRTVARILHARGELELDQDRVADAISSLSEAVELSSRLELRLLEAGARASLARALAASGKNDQAAAESGRAREIQTELELEPQLETMGPSGVPGAD